jgi:D-xylonolactonase
MRIESRSVWPIGATLGEGPMWLPDVGALWFVDIKRGMLHRYDPATGETRSLNVGGKPSFIVPADGGKLLVGSADALHLLEDGALGEPIARIDMPGHNRTNDGTVDVNGCLWFGTMDDDEALDTGAIYTFDGKTIAHTGGECIITNGPAVSADGRILYYADTLSRTIWRCDISNGPDLIDKSLFATIAEEDGAPDGITLDADGHLWVAIWGGWQARRYAPDGTIVAIVTLPCANVTKVAFGGPDLRTGYVTTASKGLSPDELTAQPLAGGLFAFDAPAPGLPLPAVRLPA